ncbi:MAG: EAL domain-containing protein [Terriglobales bacterium]
MFLFEAAKQALHPKITIWISHAVTILFATLVAAVVSFIVLRKEERSPHPVSLPVLTSRQVGMRLGVAFGLLIAILIGIGCLGLGRMDQINAKREEMLGRRWAKQQLSRQALAYSTRNSRITMEMFFLQDKRVIDPLLKSRAENSQKISELVMKLEAQCDSPEEKRLLAAVKDARGPYVASYLRALHLLVDEGKQDAARALMVEETTPALFKYHYAWDSFMQFQMDQVDKAANESRASYTTTRALVVFLIMLAVIVAVTVAFFVTLKMTEEMRTRIAAEREVRELNAGLEGRVELRTQELAHSNQLLTSEIAERKSAQDRLHLQAAALDAAANSIMITDITGKILWVNSAFTRLTGYRAAEAIGQNPRLLSSGKHDSSFYASLWKTISSGEVWHGELTNRRKDGSLYQEEMTIAPVRAATDEITHFVAIKQDITSRKAVGQALLHAQEKYRALVEDAIVGIFQATPDGGVISANPAMARIHGYESPEQLMSEVSNAGRQLFVNPAQLQELSRVLEENGVAHDVELEVYRKDRTKRWTQGNLRAVRGPDGKVVRHEGTIQDITERRRAQEALVESENRYRSLFENMLEGFAYCKMLLDDDGHPIDFIYLAVNHAFGKLTGLENVVGKRVTEVILGIKESQPELFEIYGRVALTGEPEKFEIELKALGIWFSISAYSTGNGCFIATFDNVTERKRAELALREAEEQYRTIFEENSIGMCYYSTADGRYLNVNPAFARIFGYDSPEEMLAGVSDASQLYVDPSRHRELSLQLREQGKYENWEFQGYRKDGSKIWLQASTRAVRGADGSVLYYVGAAEDITEHKLLEEQVRYLAYFDALTGLPNRSLLQDRLAKALASARRRGEKVALLFLDLDRFKTINDSLGHSAGDLLLKEVAERLTKWAREQDTVARLGGDEFVVVLTGIKDVTGAAIAADRLIKEMSTEFTVQGHLLSATCSLGISVFPDHGRDGEALIKNADAAMYCAKENGRNNFQFFTPEMNSRAVERLTLESSLRLALEKKELFLVYQPQWDVATGKITGAEALLRWQHPRLGLVPPDKFIPIAENSGLIMPIGEWVLKTACAQARQWQDQGLPPLPVAVNVSAVQFRQESFPELIRRVLHETGLPAQYLELELTESLLLSSADVTLSVLQELKEMGVNLSIDDFGTGYSSLSYLKHLPVYKLKIDRSFVRDITVDPDDAAITGTIISMAKSLNLKVIAEGVENAEQMLFLQEHDCDEVQGYYFSRPLAVDDFSAKVRSTLVLQSDLQATTAADNH